MSNPLPLLLLPRLRSEGPYSEKKNDEMMRRLWQKAWFVEYRQQLKAYREHCEMMRMLWQKALFVEYRQQLTAYRERYGKAPVYPTEKVEQVEQEVDAWMRTLYPGYTR